MTSGFWHWIPDRSFTDSDFPTNIALTYQLLVSIPIGKCSDVSHGDMVTYQFPDSRMSFEERPDFHIIK